jgi:Na+/H+-dicarboxylate symporter
MPWYKQLHWQIILGLVLGLAYGILAAASGWQPFTLDWIAPFGTIFLRLLQFIAMPLVLASLITGVASLSNMQRLSRIGSKTIAIYLGTTAVAITLGLVVVNVLRPGESVPAEMRDRLQATYAEDASARQEQAAATQSRGPLQALVDIFPGNFIEAAGNNRNMLQVVFVAIFMGIGLLAIPREKSAPLLQFFDSLNTLVIKLVDLIMKVAPIGVFALLAGTITSIAEGGLRDIVELLAALGIYCIAVVFGLAIHLFVVYPSLLRFFSPMGVVRFFRGMAPAQLVAFSTSSSGATLPVSMECAEKNLGVSEEITSFVLPLGATINMDGTALYMGVAAVFIAQTLGLELGFAAQATIVLTALLASIGTAAVPSAGIVMLIIVLESVGVPAAGIALILGVDRILDMLRTVVNITGDAVVATIVAAGEGELRIPEPAP